MAPAQIAALRQLIAQGNLGKVIAKLLESAPLLSEDQQKEVYALSGRWQRLQQKIRQGLLTEDEQAVELRKIERAVLDFLTASLTDDDSLVTTTDDGFPAASPWKRYAAVAVTVIAVLAGLAEITGLNLMSFFEQGESATSSASEPPEEQDTVSFSSLPPVDPDGGLPSEDPPTAAPNRLVEHTPQTAEEELEDGRPDSSTLPTAPDKLKIQTQTNKGAGPATFTSAETMRVYYQVNRPCLLRVIYKLADGRLILFENDRDVTETQVGKFVELGDGYEAAEPYGEEQMYFFAQSEPFPPLETRMTADGYPEITEGLQESLRKTRGFKKKIYQVESVLSIRTKE